MIAALVAGGLLAADTAVRAQNSTNTPPPAARPPGAHGTKGGMNLDYISNQLGLSEDQKAKAKPVFEEMRQKFADLRKDTTLDQTERRAKMKEIRDDATAKLKEILTPEQLQKWQNMGRGMRRPQGAAQPPQ